MRTPSKNNDVKNYDNEIEDIDEIEGTDIKINPDYYIHQGLLRAQKALTQENVKEGFLQYRLIIEHIEVLCKAAKMLESDYEDILEEFKKTEEYREEKDTLVQSVKLANKKLSLMMEAVFSNKVSTSPLKA